MNGQISRQKLKPCPFCGSLAVVESQQYYALYNIRCTGCNVKTPTNIDKKIIMKLWNKRTGESNGRLY